MRGRARLSTYIRHQRGIILRRIFTAASALVFLSARVAAQTQTARLVGTVHDGSGASIPNAMVTATQEQTRQTAETATNTSGEYVFPSLQPGAYTLSVEAPGFRKVLVNGLQLDAAANLSQTVALEVGQVSETLEVRADAVSVQATDAQLNQSVTL